MWVYHDFFTTRIRPNDTDPKHWKLHFLLVFKFFLYPLTEKYDGLEDVPELPDDLGPGKRVQVVVRVDHRSV